MQLTHPTLLGLILPVAVLVLLLERRVPGSRRRRVARWMGRTAIAALLLVALAGPYAPLETAQSQRLVVALDTSSDMSPRAAAEARAVLEEAVHAAWREGVATSVVAFARHAGPVRPLRAGRRDLEPPRPPEADGPAGARLEAGLAAAELAFAEAELGRVLLLTSGRGDIRGAEVQRARLAERGIEVQALALPRTEPAAPRPQPRIEAFQAPAVARGPFAVRVAVDARGEDVRVRLYVDGAAREARLLGAGAQSEARFTLADLPPGEHELAVALERTGVGAADGDAAAGRVEFRRTLVTIGAPPRALALLVDPERSDLRRALSAQGLAVQALPPAAATEALTEGPAVDLVVLDAASAVQLDPTAQTVLAERVRQGLGLLFEAGHDVRAWEALGDRALAAVLPLRPVVEEAREPDRPEPAPPPPPPTPPPPPVEPPEDDEGPGVEARRQPSRALPITLLLLIDRSASMHGEKLLLAIEGARRAAAALSRWDRIGVITFADQPTLDFPPRSAASAANLPLWLSTVQAGGGTDIFRALRLASQVLAKETTPIQHVILLSDGKTGGVKMWPQVVGPMGQRGVTVTAVGIGAGHSRRELRGIIQWAARGSLVSVDDASELPTVMTKDTRGITGRRDVEAERLDRLANPDRQPEPPDTPEPREAPEPPPPQPDVPEPAPPQPAAPEGPALAPLVRVRAHEALRGFDATNLPAVAPPRACAPAFGAVLLLTRDEAPVLAARRYGLGRVLQWVLPPDDPGARAWPELGRLFGQGARAVMAPEGVFRFLPRVVVTPTPDGDRVHVEWPQGDATRVTLHWRGADGTPVSLGTFDPADPDPSRMLPRTDAAEVCRLAVELEDGRAMAPVSYLSTGARRPRDRAGDTAALAARFGPAPASGAAAARDLPSGRRERRRPLVPLFLWIAAFMLPLDVLVHRRSLQP